MHKYSILASSPDSPVVALTDELGRCHVARAVSAAPGPGATLRGDPPAIGLRALRQPDTDETYPVVIALLDCNPDAAVKLIRTKLTP